MAWSYRRRVKIIPGVYLNFSKNGVSTSIGVRGASMSFGSRGTYLNTSIPGTGIYSRRKLSGGNNNPPSDNFNPEPAEVADNIFSADIQEITSQDMKGIKEAIISAHEQREDLKKDLLKIKSSLTFSKLALALSYIFLIGIIKKSISQSIKDTIASKTEVVKQLTEQIENCYVGLDIDFEPDIKVKYDRVVEAFKNLSTSDKIWDVIGEQFEDASVTRSAASTTVKRTEVSFGIKTIPEIKSKFEPLWLKNANGVDMYFFPNFIVMYSSQTKFALIGLNEIQFSHNTVRFIETASIPKDTNVIDKTWAKVNKNGSPDKRFKGNYEIPVVKYGEIKLKTDTGLNEAYQFSNYEYSEQFASAFSVFQMTIKSLKEISGQPSELKDTVSSEE